MNLNGSCVVVTGAGRGIGRALAVGFAADGANVWSLGRTSSDLEETAALCAGGMRFVVGDVSNPADVDRLFSEAERVHGRVDVLLNNAAIYPKGPFLTAPFEQWSQAMAINVVGLAYCCRRALPGMLERGFGRVINMGSFAWKGPEAHTSAYCASKAAVTVFTKALAATVDRKLYPNVLVNELLAGVYRTGMSDVGEDASASYPHARNVATLPSGGAHGEIFLHSEVFVEHSGLRARLRGLAHRWFAN